MTLLGLPVLVKERDRRVRGIQHDFLRQHGLRGEVRKLVRREGVEAHVGETQRFARRVEPLFVQATRSVNIEVGSERSRRRMLCSSR